MWLASCLSLSFWWHVCFGLCAVDGASLLSYVVLAGSFTSGFSAIFGFFMVGSFTRGSSAGVGSFTRGSSAGVGSFTRGSSAEDFTSTISDRDPSLPVSSVFTNRRSGEEPTGCKLQVRLRAISEMRGPRTACAKMATYGDDGDVNGNGDAW